MGELVVSKFGRFFGCGNNSNSNNNNNKIIIIIILFV